MFVLLPLLIASGAYAADAPRPPCEAAPDPPYAAVDAAPNLRTGHLDRWTAPGCVGWTSPGSTLLIALAGSFRHSGTAEELVARFGAVSALRGVKYWSVTDAGWRTLITDASALAAADPQQRRADFTAGDLVAGGEVYTAERDSRSSGVVVYRMRVLQSGPDRVVATVANVSAVRRFMVSVFDPGDLQTTYFLQRLSPEVWGYYGLWGIRTGILTEGHDASSINRAVALYRHFTGVPTDRMPPAAR